MLRAETIVFIAADGHRVEVACIAAGKGIVLCSVHGRRPRTLSVRRTFDSLEFLLSTVIYVGCR